MPDELEQQIVVPTIGGRMPTRLLWTRINQAAVMRTEGKTWDEIAPAIGRADGKNARQITQEYPDHWRLAFESHCAELLTTFVGEAIRTQRGLLRLATPWRDPETGKLVYPDTRSMQLAQSAAHSLLHHAVALQTRRVEISGPGGGPISTSAEEAKPIPEAVRIAYYEALTEVQGDDRDD